ncbi:hypothetical protein RJ639_044948 [Escallonia herrerae]|uniref:Rho-GAP domain-containing protein n=1 Tax=Escallonia herrerae TaxID=1293975 RepID=A0AA88WD11_9ASTE|nr:hypothetical protein RJ639_044948 [Escallonia herrerae]
MMEVLQSPNQFTSSSSCIPGVPPPDNDGLYQHTHIIHESLINSPNSYRVAINRGYTVPEREAGRGGACRDRKRREREEGDQLSLLTVLVTVFRKSLVACRSERVEELAMEIGLPTEVRHVAHVTFDRFNGFLGLPVEFEPEVPRRPPSARNQIFSDISHMFFIYKDIMALCKDILVSDFFICHGPMHAIDLEIGFYSTSVFGVSTESMQLSFDFRGNSVPTILLMMQRRLYAHGGLQAEGIFRINGENGHEEYVREQLNSGVVPEDIDVHCLAGLIKAWFRELPNGVLDSLTPEQVMQAQSEEECAQLVRLLPPTEAALMDWAINLMADVAQLEHYNKMNERNVAMVFAPNMTQMADPLTALMYAVQVMNFLKTLIVRTLREREDCFVEPGPASHVEPSDENGHQNSSQPPTEEADEADEEGHIFLAKEPNSEGPAHPCQGGSKKGTLSFLTSIENIVPAGKRHLVESCSTEVPIQVDTAADGLEEGDTNGTNERVQLFNTRKSKTGQSSDTNIRKWSKKANERPTVRVAGHVEKSKGTSLVSRLNSRTGRVEAWR